MPSLSISLEFVKMQLFFPPLTHFYYDTSEKEKTLKQKLI